MDISGMLFSENNNSNLKLIFPECGNQRIIIETWNGYCQNAVSGEQ